MAELVVAMALEIAAVTGTEVEPQIATETRPEIVLRLVKHARAIALEARAIDLVARETAAVELAGIVSAVATLEVLGTEEPSMVPVSTAAVRAPAAAAELPAWAAVRAGVLAGAVVVVEVAAVVVGGGSEVIRLSRNSIPLHP